MKAFSHFETERGPTKQTGANRTAVCASSILAIMLLAGCASMHRQKNDFAASGVQTAAQEVDVESRTLDLTMRALHELTDQPPAELRQPFPHFQAALAWLTTAARRTEATGKRMQ